MPPGGADEEALAMGLVLQTRIAEVLRASGMFNELHAKQLFSMAAAEGVKPDAFGQDPAADANMAWHLGADAFLSGALVHDQGWTFTGAIGVRGAPATAIKPMNLGDKPVVALNKAIADLSKQIAQATKRSVAKWPDLTVGTTSDTALAAYSRCLSVVERQSMGIENPVMLNSEVLTGALNACRAALQADPKFTAAKLALALGQAIGGNDEEATKALADAGEQDSAIYWITRFWLVSRYQTPEAGEGVLRQALEKRPGFLLAQMYLCEDLTVLGKNDKALAACEEAAAATPKGVVPLLRVGKVLARLKRHDDAIKKSQDALALEANGLKSRTGRLELASRYVDANKLAEAVSTLEPIGKDENARGEELLRLGYAHQLRGQNDLAQGFYEKAIAKATAPGEWRTLGRAQYDLAIVHAKAGAKDKAKEALRQSRLTGFAPNAMDAALNEVVKDLDRPEPGDKMKKPSAKPAPREVNLFRIDAAGEVVFASGSPTPPKDFARIRFEDPYK
jgi:tetratricopeptide (TPR) repeat protein